MRRFILFCTAISALVAVPALSVAPLLDFSQALTPPRHGNYGYWGHHLAAAGDVNGDGYDDFLAVGTLPDGYTQNAYLYLYYGSPTGLNPSPVEIFWAHVLNPDIVVASGAGDVDGDGFDDVLVGVPFLDGPYWINRVFLFRGGADGIVAAHPWEYAPVGASGLRISKAGDLNGDGFADVVISDNVPRENEWFADPGALVFYGSQSGLSETPDVTIIRPQENIYFGQNFLPAGDVNRDGYDDLVVFSDRGSWSNTDPQGYFLHLFLGSASGLATSPAWEAAEWDALNFRTMDMSLAAGDFNADGRPDLAAGGHNAAPESGLAGGGSFVWYGDGAAYGTGYGWSYLSDWPNSWMGESVAAGDVNGDSIDDLLVVAPQYGMSWGDIGEELPIGRILVFFGSTAGLPTSPDLVLSSDSYAFQGYALVNAGDLNGDGRDDYGATVRTDSEEGVTGTVEIAYGRRISNFHDSGIGPLCFVGTLLDER